MKTVTCVEEGIDPSSPKHKQEHTKKYLDVRMSIYALIHYISSDLVAFTPA